jgi:hypothetical protein
MIAKESKIENFTLIVEHGSGETGFTFARRPAR